jgi:serine/threonine protein kinase
MIKILFLAANPKDTDRLHLKKEFDCVKDSIRKSDQCSVFDIVMEDHVNAADLHRHLFNYKPRIVHFSGHGNLNGEPVFVDKNDLSAPVSQQALVDLFKTINQNDRLVQCMVLNACWSEELASRLAEFVPCVVGMTSAIADKSAIAFATGFYQAIGFGWNVQSAVDFGKDQIRLVQTPGSGDWNLPKAFENAKYEPKKYVIRDQQELRVKALLHGKYYLKETRGLGLIARTDVALDLELERRVVIKTLIEPAGRGAFEREMHELALLSKHPNIVTIYGAWLRDEPPHYVREYVEGWSLRSQLDRDGRAYLPIDFVHQVLASLGDAMLFAARTGVADLGVEPEKVLIQKCQAGQGVGAVSRYHIVVCPGAGGSDYIRSVLPSRLGEASRVYVPPEYIRHSRLTSVNDQQANQYRLGVLGYEMLVGSTNFRQEAARLFSSAEAAKQSSSAQAARHLTSPEAARQPSSAAVWTKINDLDKTRRCPSFLSNAIERMINPEPGRRYPTFEEAVEAIAYRNLDVEVARESFYRTQQDTSGQDKRRFFFEFYRRLLQDSGVREVFANFPDLHDPPEEKWQKQFDALKEAIIFLLVFSLLREGHSQKRTILSRIADTHCPSPPKPTIGRFNLMRVEHYDRFGETLIDTVVKFDQGGIEEYELRRAWERAIGPGLDYLKDQLKERLSSEGTAPDRAPSGGSGPGFRSQTQGESARGQSVGNAEAEERQQIGIDFEPEDRHTLEAHFTTSLAAAIHNQTVTITFSAPVNAADRVALGVSLWLSSARAAIEAVKSAVLSWLSRKQTIIIRRLNGQDTELSLEKYTMEKAEGLIGEVLGAPTPGQERAVQNEPQPPDEVAIGGRKGDGHNYGSRAEPAVARDGPTEVNRTAFSRAARA